MIKWYCMSQCHSWLLDLNCQYYIHICSDELWPEYSGYSLILSIADSQSQWHDIVHTLLNLVWVWASSIRSNKFPVVLPYMSNYLPSDRLKAQDNSFYHLVLWYAMKLRFCFVLHALRDRILYLYSLSYSNNGGSISSSSILIGGLKARRHSGIWAFYCLIS